MRSRARRAREAAQMPSHVHATGTAALLPERTRAAILAVWALALLALIGASLFLDSPIAALAGGAALLPAAFLLAWFRVAGELPPRPYTLAAVLAINAVPVAAAAQLAQGPSHWIFPVLALNFALAGLRAGALTGLVPIGALAWSVSLRAGGAETFAFLGSALLLFALVLIIWRALEESWRRLDALANRDEPSGLGNRRALRLALDSAADEAGTASVLLIDLDRPRPANGHSAAADERALAGVGELLRGHLRAADGAFRVDAQQLLVLLPETGRDGARQLALRLGGALAGRDFGGGERVTASIGVAERLPGESVEHWLQRAEGDLRRDRNGATQSA